MATPGPDHGAALNRMLAFFGVSYAVLDIGPAFLPWEAPAGLVVGDYVGLVAPLVALGALWRAFAIQTREARPDPGPSRPAVIALFAGSVLYASGHGINLSANAIARLLEPADPAYGLAYFLDEGLGHVLWHLGILAAALGTVLSALGSRATRSAGPAVGSGVLFGLALFADAVEGQTVPLVVPGIAVVLGTMAHQVRYGRLSRGHPAVWMFGVGLMVTLAMLVIWGIWQGGFPQFSELGWV